MNIVLCPQCNKWSEVLDDGLALLAIDCPACGYSSTWLGEEEVDLDTKKININPDVDQSDIDDFMTFLNSLML